MLSMRLTATKIARAFQWTAIRDESGMADRNSNNPLRAIVDLERYVERDRMFVAAFESVGYPIIAKTLDGTITAWNPAAERLYQ
jgi:PAS domain-containing protein